MRKTIISDTSCLILLDNIQEVQILNRLFGVITTTPEVADEFGKPLPEWIELRNASDQKYKATISEEVDRGEAGAIALALEMDEAS